MKLKSNTKELQQKLAAYCRNGTQLLTNEVNQKHVTHYRRLVYAIVDDILQSAYPIFYAYTVKGIWDEVVHDFFSSHACRTPYVWKMPGEFYEYACTHQLKEKYKIPFLEDLLLFEWIELELHTMKDETFPETKAEGNWLTEPLVLNPEYRILSVKFPVHTMHPTLLETQDPGDYYILLYREPEKASIQFMDISLLFALTLEKMEEKKVLNEICQELHSLFCFPDKQFALEQMIQFCKDLQTKKMILGFS